MSSHLSDTPLSHFSDEELTDLEQRGAELAADGVDHDRTEDLEELDRLAHAIARDAYVEAFDPEKNPTDRLHAEAYARDVARLGRAEDAVEITAAEVTERESAAASCDTGMAQPEVEGIVSIAAIPAIALTISPTLHDQLFTGLGDVVLAWLASGSCATLLAVFITLTMMPGQTPVRTTANWVGLGAGILTTLGLGAMRVAYATTSGDHVFAAALTAVEAGFVVLLEVKASAVRAKTPEWIEYSSRLHQARAAVPPAREAHARRVQDRNDLETSIARHVRYCELRALRHDKVDDREQVALSALRKGYANKVADNLRRRVGGVVQRRVS
jgi:hypothetical protein